MITIGSYVIGGGVSGLAAGLASRLPVFEAAGSPGGICSSYYVRPGDTRRLPKEPEDEEVYRFEIGGGHWIFGGDPTILRFIDRMSPLKRYSRASAVYFREDDLYVDYPIQNNLRFTPPEFARKSLMEMSKPPGPFLTMKEWQLQYFGMTLCEKFFFPFHALYTAGLYESIAPQDAYKSPVNLAMAIQGAFEQADSVGYNVTFGYPLEGLDRLSKAMASLCDIHYGKSVVEIEPAKRLVVFSDGQELKYEYLLCTLPLNKTLEMAGLSVDARPDPYTSVLVLNIGGTKGPKCPPHHWLYNPDATSGFHRVGFYSSVDRSFIPLSAREQDTAVSIYVERAYDGGRKPAPAEIDNYAKAVVAELADWGYITKAEVVDPTWIDVAYTWEWPGSQWKSQALRVLEEHNIYMFGRYGRWTFQGIADSIRDGFYAGASFRGS
jgi:protoporphyrinogen oxidase